MVLWQGTRGPVRGASSGRTAPALVSGRGQVSCCHLGLSSSSSEARAGKFQPCRGRGSMDRRAARCAEAPWHHQLSAGKEGPAICGTRLAVMLLGLQGGFREPPPFISGLRPLFSPPPQMWMNARRGASVTMASAPTRAVASLASAVRAISWTLPVAAASVSAVQGGGRRLARGPERGVAHGNL